MDEFLTFTKHTTKKRLYVATKIFFVNFDVILIIKRIFSIRLKCKHNFICVGIINDITFISISTSTSDVLVMMLLERIKTTDKPRVVRKCLQSSSTKHGNLSGY